jgi:hypothetical protein
MKIIAVPILIILVMVQTFSKWIMIEEYNLNRSYIAKHLCQNRYRPQLHCNGKCVLMKKMAAEENQSSPAGTVKLSWEAFLFIDDHTEYGGKNFTVISRWVIPVKSFYKDNSFVRDVFRPPLS